MKKISNTYSPRYSSVAMSAVLITIMTVSLFVTEAAFAETRYKVKSSDNLNSIVEQFYQDSDLSKSQLMVGILVKNPRAFRGGNINFLLRGKRLTLPDESEIQQISDESASELLSKHARFFRRGITGNLATPTFIEGVGESSELLEKQRNQTAKINQLEQESESLKKQLENLVNAKADRDNQLLELERSLKEARDATANTAVIQKMPKGLERTNKELQQSLKETKSKLAENTNSNTALERRVEHLQEALQGKSIKQAPSATNEDITEKLSEDASLLQVNNLNIPPILYWLVPLLLLLGLLYFFFIRKKVETPTHTFDDYEEMLLKQDNDLDPELEEETSLETSIKLDVARAYLAAEDFDSAKDILAEIIEEGSDEQKQQAQELLKKLS